MRAALFGLVLIYNCLPHTAVGIDDLPSIEGCRARAVDLAFARDAGDTSVFRAIIDTAIADPNCDERSRHCLADSAALGHVEAAYRAADAGKSDGELRAILEAGLAYGMPWQLEAGLGDLYLELGRVGQGGPAYSKAAVHYQQALIAIGEPAVCGDFGEAARPPAESIEALYRSLSAAILLADPLEVVTTRCAPCEWLFLAGVNGFTPNTRPLPITFASGSAEPEAQSLTAIAALVECLKARGDRRVILSGHSDPTGTAEANMGLSQRRLDRVAELLKIGGFTGELELKARGEEQPFGAETGYFPERDDLRLSRRIELVSVDSGQGGRCD